MTFIRKTTKTWGLRTPFLMSKYFNGYEENHEMKNDVKVGRHAIFELYGCDSNLLDDEQYVVKVLTDAAHELGATVLSTSSYKFQPQGVTSIVLLSESHISIHTWPEKGLATCDIFTCGTCIPENGIVIFKEKFKATETNSLVFDR